MIATLATATCCIGMTGDESFDRDPLPRLILFLGGLLEINIVFCRSETQDNGIRMAALNRIEFMFSIALLRTMQLMRTLNRIVFTLC